MPACAEGGMGGLAVGRAATPRAPPGVAHAHMASGDWPAAQGHTPEACLLLWVGASEMTPWGPGAGLGVAEHQGAPPMQQRPRRRSLGLVGRGWWDRSQGNCSFSVYFFKSSSCLLLLLFLQIEIHPFSIFTFYFMSLFCLFLFNYTSRACSYLRADIV